MRPAPGPARWNGTGPWIPLDGAAACAADQANDDEKEGRRDAARHRELIAEAGNRGAVTAGNRERKGGWPATLEEFWRAGGSAGRSDEVEGVSGL